MLLLRPERPFHHCGSHPRKFLSHKVFLFGGLRWAAAFDKGGLDAALLAEVPVGRPRVTCVAAYLFHTHPVS